MTIWFSGKELQRGKLLADFVGKNEKTKVIIKIQKVCLTTHLLYKVNVRIFLLERRWCTCTRTCCIWRRTKTNDGLLLSKTTRP